MTRTWTMLPFLACFVVDGAEAQSCDFSKVSGVVWWGTETRMPVPRFVAYMAPILWFSTDEPSLLETSGWRNISSDMVGENVQSTLVSIENDFCSRSANTVRVPKKASAVGSSTAVTNWAEDSVFRYKGPTDTDTFEAGLRVTLRLRLQSCTPSSFQ